MTTEHEATRTLVKSPPELWAECSDAGSLARHLGEFGEITITRLDPETTVAWEGEHVSGTVRIEPSGWGTRVTLTAQTKAEVPETRSPPEATEANPAVPTGAEIHTLEEEADATLEETLEDADPVPVADTGRARARWRRLTARMRGVFGGREEEAADGAEEEPAAEPEVTVEAEAATQPEPEPEPEPDPEAEPSVEPAPNLDAEAVLASALDSLGQAHHRPFSRA